MSDSYFPMKVLSSSVCIGSETEGWLLDEPAGEDAQERVFLFDVFFDTPFSTAPVVHVGLTGFDLDQCSSSRLNISAVAVTERGFQVRVRTWRSSRVYSVDFNWMAIGL